MTVADTLRTIRDGLDDGSIVRESGLTTDELRADLDVAIARADKAA